MRNIAIVQRFLPSRSPGGVGVFTDGLASSLVRRGHRVTVFSQDPAPDGANYSVTMVPAGAGRLAPIRFPFAVRRCDFRGFDVIHAQGDEQWVPRRGRPPVVRTLHGTALAEAWFNGVHGLSPRRFALHSYFYLAECVADVRADFVVAVSRHTTRFYPRVDAVIPNGIDAAAWAPDGTPKSPRPSILFVGEVDSRKRGWLLIDAFRQRVRPQFPEASLWIAGSNGPSEPGIEWKGRVSDRDLRDLMRRAWVMCLPSAYEGFGRPYAEAMAAGTVAMATPNSGARDVLKNGKCGLLVRDEDLGQALIRILSSSGERAEFERRGLERVKEFDWTVVAAAYEHAYDRAMERARRRHDG